MTNVLIFFGIVVLLLVATYYASKGIANSLKEDEITHQSYVDQIMEDFCEESQEEDLTKDEDYMREWHARENYDGHRGNH